MAERSGGMVKKKQDIQDRYHAVLKRMVEIKMKNPVIVDNVEYHNLNTERADLKRELRRRENEK